MIPPTISGAQGWPVIREIISQRSLIAGLKVMGDELGPLFQVKLPSFQPLILSGPEAARQVFVTERSKFLWRNENDPVSRLLGHGLLVEDGDPHDVLRGCLQPHLNRPQVMDHLPLMLGYTDQILKTWQDGSTQDMLVEMRRLTLMILVGTLFRVEVLPDIDRLWRPILKVLEFISPGLWLIAPHLPRPGYQKAIDELDEYLYEIISTRRKNLGDSDDMLSDLVRRDEMSDELIRDQLLTMLIAGHDTSTALLAWCTYLLGQHPQVMQDLRQEVDTVIGDQQPSTKHLSRLVLIDQFIKETLRLYPPIHAGNRVVKEDMLVHDCPVPSESRILFSIYLTHRDERYWPQSGSFKPERFDHSKAPKRPALSYLPFGAGPRNCIGAAFAQIEVKAVLARIIQLFDLELVSPRVTKRMGATLEPHPGVLMKVSRRRYAKNSLNADRYDNHRELEIEQVKSSATSA